MSNKNKNKYGQKAIKNSGLYYGDNGLPYRGMVNAYTDCQIRGAHYLPFTSSNFMINNISNQPSRANLTKVPVNYHSFGSNWYPNLSIDNTYSTYSGGYSYPNGGIGPYGAVGLGNYPRKMFAEANRLYFNKPIMEESNSNKYGKSNSNNNKYKKSKNNKK